MRNLKKILCLALVLSMVLAVVSGAAYTNYADDAELTVVFVKHTYFLDPDIIVDCKFFRANSYAPPYTCKQKNRAENILRAAQQDCRLAGDVLTLSCLDAVR